ncbi:unnamed protein product [Musa acuminata subsp. malaccensis]|uniref:(wild Malaysian banana) hypothetical protein n=1 Tax=Musa acuminata subsp. malaccensis TaxID=214687 RepID=A0A804J3D2_MUSAM|nr:unnamed protein product [Musa acuminata subsp. malaccensis]
MPSTNLLVATSASCSSPSCLSKRHDPLRDKDFLVIFGLLEHLLDNCVRLSISATTFPALSTATVTLQHVASRGNYEKDTDRYNYVGEEERT